MKILGLGSPFTHDPAAALVIDGKTVAAAEEERFTRRKHAPRELPRRAAEYCLEAAGLNIDAVDGIAFAWSPKSYRRDLPAYLRRTWWTRPVRAYRALSHGGQEHRERERRVHQLVRDLGGTRTPPINWIDHHLAHAASCFYLSGWRDAAILTIDGSGEFTSTFLAEGRDGSILPLQRIVNPDSLGFFYSTVTEFLGFDRDDGEFKTMGMSAYGDPCRANISPLLQWTTDGAPNYRVNDDYVWCSRRKRWDRGKVFGSTMVELWGQPRTGDALEEPYIHIAAAAQKALEDIVSLFLSTSLRPALERSEGRLCLAGGCALNVRMNQKLLRHPLVNQIWVQPAAHDAGAPLGAALVVAQQHGDPIEPMKHVYLGPSYDAAESKRTLEQFTIPYRTYPDGCIVDRVASLLAKGEIVAWFQGRMEFGPRALGNRSILGHPHLPGTADRINREIKYRESWRPFGPSIAEDVAVEVLRHEHSCPFMTFAFEVSPAWRDRIREAMHVDGTTRPHIVDRNENPRYYALLKSFGERAGVPVVINTSFNRRGEPMVCSPADALRTFYGSGIQYLALGDQLVAKNPRHLEEEA